MLRLLGASILSLAGLPPWAAFAVSVVISVKTQVADQVRVKDTSQLIKGMFKLLQKILKCFNEKQFQDIF